MKIVIIPSWYPPDGGPFFRDRAMELLHRGNDVAILYAKPYPKSNVINRLRNLRQNDLSVSYEDGLTVYRSYFSGVPRLPISTPLLYALACTRLFSKYVKDNGALPDIIIANSSVWAGYASARIKKEFNVPYIITEHRGRFSLMSEEAKKSIKWWFPFYLKSAFHRVDHLILDGSFLINGLKQYLPEQVRWEVISNGVDTAFFTPAEHRDDSSFKILTVAGLNHGKGIDLLLSAYLQLHAKYKKTRLIIRGDGPEREKLQQLVSENNLNHVVSFINRLDREGLRDLYRGAHLFVLPTRFEGQGLVYIEAMSFGLPVIGTEAAPPESCPSFAGFRVPIDNSAALRDAMEYVLNNYESFDRNRIRQFAVTEHDHSVVTDKVIAVCDQILAGTKKILR